MNELLKNILVIMLILLPGVMLSAALLAPNLWMSILFTFLCLYWTVKTSIYIDRGEL